MAKKKARKVGRFMSGMKNMKPLGIDWIAVALASPAVISVIAAIYIGAKY